jgi:hypothetical protein
MGYMSYWTGYSLGSPTTMGHALEKRPGIANRSQTGFNGNTTSRCCSRKSDSVKGRLHIMARRQPSVTMSWFVMQVMEGECVTG